MTRTMSACRLRSSINVCGKRMELFRWSQLIEKICRREDGQRRVLIIFQVARDDSIEVVGRRGGVLRRAFVIGYRRGERDGESRMVNRTNTHGLQQLSDGLSQVADTLSFARDVENVERRDA